MLYWIWRALWWPPAEVRRTSRKRLATRITELEPRVLAVELALKKLTGRLTGGLRIAPDEPELELDDELVDQVDDHALGAEYRFGKGS